MIKEGLLEIPVCESPAEGQLFCTLWQKLMPIGLHFLPKIYGIFASLQLQLRRIAEHPSMQTVMGKPSLWRRELLFDIDQFTEFKDDWIACAP